MNKRLKSIAKLLLKLSISAGALLIVFRSINWEVTQEILLNSSLSGLVVATLFFAASKVLSAYRLLFFFRSIDLTLSFAYNLRLAWVGMFYNLFLPGGIGGDTYKVYLLHKQSGISAKSIGAAVLLDRINGMVALIFLAGVGFMILNPDTLPLGLKALVMAGTLLTYPAYMLLVRLLFKSFTSRFWETTVLSFGTQICQLVASYFILMSLGLGAGYLAYLVVFLVSSVVAVLPFTIGGIGARELTFILGNRLIGIDENLAVAFSLAFFLITLVTSSVGGFLPTTTGNQDSRASNTSMT